MRRNLGVAILISIVLAFGLALGGIFRTPQSASSAPAQQEDVLPEKEVKELREFARKFSQLFRYTARKVQPSVVWIQAEKIIKYRTPGFGQDDPMFRRFFGPEFRDFFGPQEREYRKRGLGSGVIFDSEGYILTNNHVVEGADKLEVKLADGRTFKAKLAGADPDTELAVIKLQGDKVKNLPVAELGNSEKLHVGEWVIAIGNPLGLSHSVSAGIVSAKGRGIGIAKYENMIQTDAAINPGNSGGPLVNLQGEIVGINTAIVSRTGGYMGIGLAIPVNMAKSILKDLMAGRKVERGFLGIIGDSLTPELAEQFDYKGNTGALVNEVIDDTPAQKAGLKAGDIIVGWNGKTVKDFSHLRRLVAAAEPGQKVKVKVWREGEHKTLTIEVARLSHYQETAQDNWLGIKVKPVTEEVKEAYGRRDLHGVVIAEVKKAGPARALEAGDVILSIQRKPVRSVAEFQKLVAKTTPQKGALLRVLSQRTGHAKFLYIRGR